MNTTYTLTRVFDDPPNDYTTFSVTNDDAINCAYMLAAGFNTMSRNFTNGFVLAVVDTSAGTVQYEGKTERIERSNPYSVSTSIDFTADTDGDTLVTLFGDEGARLLFPAKMQFAENTTAAEALAESNAGHLARSVLEEAYEELQAVKEVLADAGVETTPADAGATDLRAVLRARDMQIGELAQQNSEHAAEALEFSALLTRERNGWEAYKRTEAEQAEEARAEMIAYLKGADAKRRKVDPYDKREELQARYSGMLDVFAKFLVATGEADPDEGHAAARRLINETED